MAYRLTHITTRTGDQGSTSLGDGTRVEKDHPRIELLGTLDELNCVIGLLRAESLPAPMDLQLARIQNDLFHLGAEVAVPQHTRLLPDRIGELELQVEEHNRQLPPLKEFLLPGGGRSAAVCHLARTVARRAERQLVTLQRTELLNAVALPYLNRLSDLLFVMARSLNRAAGHPDVLWDPAYK